MSISKNLKSSVQIAFHLRSKIRSKSFPKTFKHLRTENALLHKPFVQNADSAVIFIDPCPEICILKAGKLPLNLSRSRGSNFQWELFLPGPDRCVLLGIWGLRVGPSGLLGKPRWRQLCAVPLHGRHQLHKQPTGWGCALSKRKAAEDGYVDVW